jgi:8-oxo-dGTP diphosphatase
VPFTYDYARPAVTADVVIFTMRADDLAVLLIRRGEPPFKGAWALPGGHVESNESLEKAASRELEEETGLTNVPFEQLGAFGDPGRDPRGHYVTVAFYTFIGSESVRVKAGDDASEVAWLPLRSLDLASTVGSSGKRGIPAAPPSAPVTGSRAAVRGKKAPQLLRLAFDHAKILRLAVERLRERLLEPSRPSRFHLVPPNFTLVELRRVYEVIFGRAIDPRAFRIGMLARDFIEPIAAVKTSSKKTGKKAPKTKPREKAGMLYRFKHAPHRRSTIDD